MCCSCDSNGRQLGMWAPVHPDRYMTSWLVVFSHANLWATCVPSVFSAGFAATDQWVHWWLCYGLILPSLVAITIWGHGHCSRDPSRATCPSACLCTSQSSNKMSVRWPMTGSTLLAGAKGTLSRRPKRPSQPWSETVSNMLVGVKTPSLSS